MGRDLFIFAMLSPAELKHRSKDPVLTGSIPEEDDDEDDDDDDEALSLMCSYMLYCLLVW